MSESKERKVTVRLSQSQADSLEWMAGLVGSKTKAVRAALSLLSLALTAQARGRSIVIGDKKVTIKEARGSRD